MNNFNEIVRMKELAVIDLLEIGLTQKNIILEVQKQFGSGISPRKICEINTKRLANSKIFYETTKIAVEMLINQTSQIISNTNSKEFNDKWIKIKENSEIALLTITNKLKQF